MVHGAYRECERDAGWYEPQRPTDHLKRLLGEIHQTAQTAGASAWLKPELERVRRSIHGMSDSDAERILDAIQLGEDFAVLYMQGLIENPWCASGPVLRGRHRGRVAW